MTFITRKNLDRRTFLRGASATIALPALDAMIPALTPGALAAVRRPRLGFIYVAHGAVMNQWTPTTTGTDFAFTRPLQPLESLRSHVNILSNLVHYQANSLGDGPADHARSGPVWLSGVHAKKTEGEDVRAGRTIDQIAAESIGQDTLYPSLEITTEDMTGLIGACDAGYSCTYLNTISWKTETQPLPMEINPRNVFERLFGFEQTPEARQARLAMDRSILDEIQGSVGTFRKGLGADDRQRMEQYFDNLREIERRLQVAESRQGTGLDVPDAPIGVPDNFEDHTKSMLDLMALAFETDMSRIFTFMLVRDVSQRSYPQIGVPDPHHATSHHQNDPEKLEKLVRINTYHVSMLAHFLEKLKTTPDVDGSLLDNSMVLYGSGMSNSDQHDHDPLPTILAGGGAGSLKTGQHVMYDSGTPMSNLLLSMLNKAGVPTERVGDSTGLLPHI